MIAILNVIIVCLLIFWWWKRNKHLQLSPFCGVLAIIGNVLEAIGGGSSYLLTLRPRGAVLPPSLPGRVPILGNIYMLLGNSIHIWRVLKGFSKHSSKQDGVNLVHFGPHNFFVITDPDDAMALANRHLEKPYIYDFTKPWLANGLITANASIWKPHRKLIAPAFNSSTLNTYMLVFNDSARKIADGMATWIGKGHFDPTDLIARVVLENSSLTTFGLQRGGSNFVEEYCHKVEYFVDSLRHRFSRFWLHIPMLYNLSSLKTKLDDTANELKSMGHDVICKRQALRFARSKSTDISQTEYFKPLLDFMLDTNEMQKSYTDEQIRAHLDTVSAAALDTTTSALIFVLAVIGSYRNVQEKIYKELKEIFEDSNRDLDKYDLTKLVYLEAVVKETLRVYPPVPCILRSSNQEVKLKNYTLPPHGTYAISIYGVNRHPMWGPDADQFRPERWLEPGGLPDNPNAFASFSLGRRNCIGRLYSMMFMKTTLVHVLRRYRLKSDISKLVLRWNITLQPVTGHEITIEELS